MKKQRIIGQIRQTPLPASTPPPSTLPHSITDLTINNINLYKEMKQIDMFGADIFDRYDKIIRDLQSVIADLQERNGFINDQRKRLFTQNVRLREQIRVLEESVYMPSRKIGNVVLFDVVPEEDSIPVLFSKPKKKPSNQILQQSQFDLGPTLTHHFTSNISAELSISPTSSQQPNPANQSLTPHLHNPHSLVQCKSNNNQAPLRIFYLLLLQQHIYIQKLRSLLKLCIQDQSKVLLYLLPKDNELWVKILEGFLDTVEKGKFQNQGEIIEYVQENPLIDVLLVSLLKQILPVENQDEDLNLGDWKNQNIDHRALFMGLCNQFQFTFEQDSINRVYKFYSNVERSVNHLNSQESEQCLLQSRARDSDQQPVQISLFSRPANMQSSKALSNRQPLFKIWVDPQRLYYRFHVSIRHAKGQEDDEYAQTSSFHQTQNNENIEQNEDYNESVISQQQQQGGIKRILILGQKNQNQNQRNLISEYSSNKKKYKYNQEEYLKQKESKQISKNNSRCYL